MYLEMLNFNSEVRMIKATIEEKTKNCDQCAYASSITSHLKAHEHTLVKNLTNVPSVSLHPLIQVLWANI